jgi:hypothetical protein
VASETFSLCPRQLNVEIYSDGCLRTDLWRVLGPKWEEVVGSWRKLRNKELHDLYASPNIIRVIKSITMGWVGHVAWTGEVRNSYIFFVGNWKGTDHLEDLGIDGKIILEWILGKYGGRVWTGFI